MENTMFRDPVDAMGFGWFMDSLTDPYFLLGVVSCDTYQNFFQESAFWRFWNA